MNFQLRKQEKDQVNIKGCALVQTRVSPKVAD